MSQKSSFRFLKNRIFFDFFQSASQTDCQFLTGIFKNDVIRHFWKFRSKTDRLAGDRFEKSKKLDFSRKSGKIFEFFSKFFFSDPFFQGKRGPVDFLQGTGFFGRFWYKKRQCLGDNFPRFSRKIREKIFSRIFPRKSRKIFEIFEKFEISNFFFSKNFRNFSSSGS